MHTLRAHLYLHPNVHHRGIQEVKDSGSDTISSVLGKPAIAAQCILGAQGGHSQTQLLHQPAALGGGPIMAQLCGDTRGCEDLGTTGKEALPALLIIPFSLSLSASFQCALDSLTQVPPWRGKDFADTIKVSNQMTLS